MKQAILLFLLAAYLCPAAVTTQGNAAYVVDKGRGKVWVLDLSSRRSDEILSTGAGASEMLVLPSNRLGFVSNYDSGTVTALDLWNNNVKATIEVSQGPGPSGLAATPDGLFVYVTDSVNNTVSVIDTTALSVFNTIPVGQTPVQVKIEPTGRFAYVVNKAGGTVSVIDISRQKVVKVLNVGAQPSQFVILPNRNLAYVVNSASNNLTLVDLSLNATAGSVPVGTGPVGVAYPRDGSKLYVVNGGSNNISVLDTGTNAELALIPVCLQPAAMVVNHDSTSGYVSCQGFNTVTLLNLTNNTYYKQIGVGSQPSGLALDPNEDYLFVANTGSGNVTVIDVEQEALSSAITGPGVGSMPVQLAFLNPPGLLEVAPNPAVSGSTVFVTGEGFMQSSRVRITTASNQAFTVTPAAMSQQVLQVDLPAYQDAEATVEVINADRSTSGRVALYSGIAGPAIYPYGVVEAAGFAAGQPPTISGNALVAVFGSFPGMARADAPANLFPLPRSLGNAKVTFNGVPAPILATIPLPESGYYQINALAPVRLLARNDVHVAVTIGNETSQVELIHVDSASPGIFYNFADGSAIAAHVDGSLVTSASPAVRGEDVVIYVTGLGGTKPPPIEGDAAPADTPAPALLPVTVVVAGVNSPQVSFSGLASGFSGLYRVRFQVPPAQSVTGIVDLKIIVAGRESNVVKIAAR